METARGQEGPSGRSESATSHADAQTSQPQIVAPEATPLRLLFDEAVKIYRTDKTESDATDRAEQERESSDLEAQWIMAVAGAAMAVFTLAQLFVGGFTLWFLFKTFKATERTANAAVEAASGGERSARAAEGLVYQARTNAERQLRAYVSAEVVDGEVKYKDVRRIGGISVETEVSVTLVLRNRGHTPAHDLTYWVKFAVDNFKNPKLDYTRPSEYVAKIVLHPNGERTRPQTIRLDHGLLSQIEDGAAIRLYLWGVVNYRDVFKQSRETRFRLMYGGDESTKRKTIWWCDEGNEAT